jgi:hypothetical protein
MVDRKKRAPLVQGETGGVESEYNTYTGKPTSLDEEGSRALAQRRYRPEYEGASKYSDKLDFTGESKVNLNKRSEGGEGYYDRKRKAVFDPKTGVFTEKVQRKSGIGYKKTGRTDARGAEDYLANQRQQQAQSRQEKQRKKDLKKQRKENNKKRKEQARADKKNPKLIYDGSNWVKNPDYKSPQEGNRKYMGGGKIKKRKYL